MEDSYLFMIENAKCHHTNHANLISKWCDNYIKRFILAHERKYQMRFILIVRY